MEQLTNPVLVHIGSSVAVSSLPEYCRKSGLDTTVAEYDAVTVEDARGLVALAKERPLEASVRTIVILTRQFSEVVQNTLLKILEEPPATTHIHLILPRVGILLPTVRSRVQIVATEDVPTQYEADVVRFLADSPSERLQHIAVWQKAENEQAGREVMYAVADWIRTHPEQASLQLRKTVQQVETWYQLPGASRKMLLEEIALSAPKIVVDAIQAS